MLTACLRFDAYESLRKLTLGYVNFVYFIGIFRFYGMLTACLRNAYGMLTVCLRMLTKAYARLRKLTLEDLIPVFQLTGANRYGFSTPSLSRRKKLLQHSVFAPAN